MTDQPILYQCDDCGFTYDPAKFGGKDLDEQPLDFECPQCQAGPNHFHLLTPSADDIAGPPEADDSMPLDPAGPRVMFTQESSPSLETLFARYSRGRIDTQPEFQRYEVWSAQKKSALVESILLDLPVPQIFLSQEPDTKDVVVDGQQRLMAIFRYMKNEYSLTRVAPAIEGKKFLSLETVLQEKINNYQLRVVTILKESDPEVRFMLFKRLNEGSVGLNDQELRNCVSRGPYNEFLKSTAADLEWRKLLGLKSKPHPRMVDVELVLRYMAFRDQGYMKHPDKKTGQFLDRQMKLGSLYAEKDFKAAKADFRQSVDLARTIYGDHACKRFIPGKSDTRGSWDSRLVRALMDVQLWGFKRFPKPLFVKNADAVFEASIELMCNPTFIDLIGHTTGELKRVENRFDLWRQMLDSVLGEQISGPRLFSRKDRESAFALNPECAICGQKIQILDDAHMDHIHPYSKGGATEAVNGALTHRFCNLSKSDS